MRDTHKQVAIVDGETFVGDHKIEGPSRGRGIVVVQETGERDRAVHDDNVNVRPQDVVVLYCWWIAGSLSGSQEKELVIRDDGLVEPLFHGFARLVAAPGQCGTA